MNTEELTVLADRGYFKGEEILACDRRGRNVLVHDSVEELSGLKMLIRPKRRLSPAGVRHAGRYQLTGKTQQRFVTRIIDARLLSVDQVGR